MKTSTRLTALALSTLMFLPGTAAQANDKFTYDGPVITLRYSTFVPETHPMSKAVTQPWMRMVEQESNGKIKIKAYFSGVLHGSKDGFKAIVNDITDMTSAYVNYQPGSFHLPHALDLPFAFPNAQVAGRVAEELYPKYFKKEYEAMGVYLGHYAANGSYNLFTKKPVATLEDLKGMKIRSSGGESSILLRALGAVPVAVPVSEAYNAFQRGVVDGVALYNTGAVGYRVSELATHMTEARLNNPANAYAFNPKTWKALPPEVQSYMYGMLRRLSIMQGLAFDSKDIVSRKGFVDQGMKIIELSPKERERWRAAVNPLWQKFIDENEAEGRPARALIADMTALTKKYGAMTREELEAYAKAHPVHGIISGM